MKEFEKAFGRLNKKQLQAVKQIEGPMLVIAGPGTGKTQLISTRAGYILKNTDTTASDILCLTFTNSGVSEMRERLIKLIGQDAYNINLHTYHAFGGEILRRNPEYFDEQQLEPIEDLRQDIMLRDIVARLPYSNPLKYADSYLSDVKAFIGEDKQALLSPDDITTIAADNLRSIEELNKKAQTTLASITSVSKSTVPLFKKLLPALKTSQKTGAKLPQKVLPMVNYSMAELNEALDDFKSSGSTTALTQWKRTWLEKNTKGDFVFKGKKVNEKLSAAAGIYKTYQQALKSQGLYDYQDMILRAIKVLEKNPDFKHTLAEQYQYIMLDEFQDTNPSQMRLVELLTDHPVHEGRPNVLAVGDDDQAIYAFQGADHANMAYFAEHYKDVKIISLEDSYRSHQELLDTAQNIASQIEQRLHHNFPGVGKILKASNKSLPASPALSARQFKSDAAQHTWIAHEIKRLISKEGIAPKEIAVLAPKHKYLIPLLPHLAAAGLPVRYEKRENVLDAPIVRQLTQMSHLVLALASSNDGLASEIWPEVLSYDFWAVPTDKIWSQSWSARQNHQPWTAVLLKDKTTKPIAEFFLRLASLAPQTTLEQILDGLIGLPEANNELNLPMTSPLFGRSFSPEASKQEAQSFVSLVSNLSILRERLREWARSGESPLGIGAFVQFIEGHQEAGINIINESPYHGADDAINLLTAYGAKGREFKAVFVVAAQDEVWGSASRNQGYRLALPPNLSYIRYQGASENERLRLLFVAMTRAMTHLYLTSYAQTLGGKATSRLKYLDISESDDGQLRSQVLPEKFSAILKDDSESIDAQAAEYYWTGRHTPPFSPKLRTVLKPQLDRYQLSVTHLNQFTDLERAGPEACFLKSILGFPEAPTRTTIYGTAIHETLRMIGGFKRRGQKLPSEKKVIDFFSQRLSNQRLPAEELELLVQKGTASLRAWLGQRAAGLGPKDRYEYDFKNEGVFLGQAHLAGKVDRLIVNEKARIVSVLDYKTGQSYERWQPGVIKLHKFRQQLIMYKLLVENSARFKGYKVDKGIIEFVEPNEEGRIVQLELSYTDEELEDLKKLISTVWRRIQKIDLPDTKKYPRNLSGIRAFENDLRSNI